MKALLAAGADTDAAMADGTTPLHAAATMGHVEIVELLLAAGADKDTQACGNVPAWYEGRLCSVLWALRARGRRAAARSTPGVRVGGPRVRCLQGSHYDSASRQ